MSSDGAAVTTVDSGSQLAAQFNNAENNGAVQHGFTFVNGSGIQIFAASPIIEDNVITGNQNCQAGGIYLLNSSAIVRSNTISNNIQTCPGGATAGGIAVDGAGSVQILNNIITGNQTAPGLRAAESSPMQSVQRQLRTTKSRTTLPMLQVVEFILTGHSSLLPAI